MIDEGLLRDTFPDYLIKRVSNQWIMEVPRDDILRYSFVLKPLTDIAPDLIHPITNRPVIDHWRSMDKTLHPLTLINMDLS